MVIAVESFIKRYGDFVAVAGTSFVVPAGSVAALVGPNGAGKTTTIRTLCGILRPTAGKITVAEADLEAEGLQVKQRAAYVPDDPPLFDSLTVFEHLGFIAQAYRLNDWHADAENLLEQFDLGEKRNTLASELSRGMRQKVAIACAYLRRPDVLLLDEPMTGLDPPSISHTQGHHPRTVGAWRNRLGQLTSALIGRRLMRLPGPDSKGKGTFSRADANRPRAVRGRRAITRRSLLSPDGRARGKRRRRRSGE